MCPDDLFSTSELTVVNDAVALAEELVSNHYKMSTSQWLNRRYDVKSRVDLTDNEVVQGPFAQVIRYEGRQTASPLNSRTFDFYKICLQDQAILGALRRSPDLDLGPFVLYVVTHELIHIVRFSTFRQSFQASDDERWFEEQRVHAETHAILAPVEIRGMAAILDFFSRWHTGMDRLQDF